MLSRPVEQATLRPVPLRPAGPVDPAEALAHVRGALPDLSEDAARALSLIEIAGRTRDKALDELELSAAALAELLYVARKTLRRSVFPLSASGWCERAERLLSDRIDGVLVPPGPARLDVHLRNCERCVDHERRLSQAREKLVREFIDAHPHTAGAGPAERPAAALRVVEPVVVEPAYDGPTRVVTTFGGFISEPAGRAPLPRPSFAGPGGQVEIRLERAPVAAETEESPAVDADDLPPDPPFDDDIPPSEPADTTPSEHDAEEPDPPVEETQDAVGPATLGWGGLSVVSLGLAVFALVVMVLAVYGLASL
jgi:Putative zinc-finger